MDKFDVTVVGITLLVLLIVVAVSWRYNNDE